MRLGKDAKSFPREIRPGYLFHSDGQGESHRRVGCRKRSCAGDAGTSRISGRRMPGRPGSPGRYRNSNRALNAIPYREDAQCFEVYILSPKLSEKFRDSLLARNVDLEEDLCGQLFNHSEKRLARVLPETGAFRPGDPCPAAKMPRISHETLAEIVGTTRSRITHFMNKFRRLRPDRPQRGEVTVRGRIADGRGFSRLRMNTDDALQGFIHRWRP